MCVCIFEIFFFSDGVEAVCVPEKEGKGEEEEGRRERKA